MTDAEKRIREALAAGPTPGEWFSVNDGTRGEPFMNVKAERISGRGPTHEVAICATGDSPQSMETANARYIAACHPAAIRELLAEHDALKVENEKLLALERDMSNALPGAYYMDPPDGGSAPLGEQVRRMAVDAARYRWLRGEHKRVDPICAVIWKRNGDRNGSEWVNTANIDAEIDAAMGASNE